MSNDYVIDKITGMQIVFKNGEGIFTISPTEITYTPAPDNISEEIESQELDDFLEGFRKRDADGVF